MAAGRCHRWGSRGGGPDDCRLHQRTELLAWTATAEASALAAITGVAFLCDR